MRVYRRNLSGGWKAGTGGVAEVKPRAAWAEAGQTTVFREPFGGAKRVARMSSSPLSRMYRVPEAILNEMEGAQRILIVGHQRPDLDTLGSALPLGQMLSWMGKEVEVCIDDELPGTLRRFDDRTDQDPEIKTADQLSHDPYDLVILVDIASSNRIGRARERLPSAKSVMVIDHHEVLPDRKDLGLRSRTPLLAWIDSQADATGLLIAGVVEGLAKRMKGSKLRGQQWGELAIPLAAAILSDTRDFTKPGVSDKAQQAYRDLVRRCLGSDAEVRDLMNYRIPQEAAVILQKAFDEVVSKDGSHAMLVVNQKSIEQALVVAKEADPAVTEEDLRYFALHQIDDHLETQDLSVLLWETQHAVLVSSRSREPGPALSFIEELPRTLACSGGGHADMAAGVCELPALGTMKRLVRSQLEAYALAREASLKSQGSI